MRLVRGAQAEAAVDKLRRRAINEAELEPEVRRIVEDVRRNGDKALLRYATKWDRLAKGSPVRVSSREMQAAWEESSPQFRKALKVAAANIRSFAEWQMPKSKMKSSDSDNGIRTGQVVRPLQSVGCYVPGGRYPLPSSLLMTVTAAQVAGVHDISVVSPNPARETLAAAALLGVKNFYRVGGAQAIAALAFGTASIPRVDKIVGPGNRYVTIAKRLVAFECAIDFVAGPTEVVVLSHKGNASFIASDLVAQAEHDADAVSIFITTSQRLASDVMKNVGELSRDNSTAQQSLRQNGLVLIATTRSQAIEWCNAIAPEHISVEKEDLPGIQNAGSIFVGDYSPQAVGDYCSGPNHVLPTGGYARCRGGLSVWDFVKIIAVQELTLPGLRSLASTTTTLAQAEGLVAHAQSVERRVDLE